MTALPGTTVVRRAVPTALRNPLLAVFVVALVARVARAQVVGGFTQPNGYDQGVYYAGAAGLVNGAVPYRDFSFVHPPGIVLVEAPFALIGRLTTDLAGYVAANVAVVLMAAASAVLVVLVARAMGLPDRAALTGGLAYALWANAVAFEASARLEPVGNLFVLCGLLALQRGLDVEGRRGEVLRGLAGVGLGMAVCVKIWWIVPVAVLLGWHLVSGRRVRPLVPVVAGGALTMLVVNLPFLLLARAAMWESVVLDQVDRSSNLVPHTRVYSHLVAGSWSDDRPEAVQLAMIAAGLGVLGLVVVRAWRTPAARPLVAVLAVQLAQLWFQPIWFPFYSDFTTVALCLLVAAAFGVPRGDEHQERPWLRRNLAPVAVVLVLAVNVTAFVQSLAPAPAPFPRSALATELADVQCVASDQPMGLIQVDALSRSFQNDCAPWIDMVGRRLRFARVAEPGEVWEEVVVRHFRKSDALLLTRSREELGFSLRTWRKLQRDGLLVEVGGYPVYRMPGKR